MNMTIWNVVNAIWVMWVAGVFIGWKLLGALLALLSTGQLGWQFWRWADDAEEREEDNENYITGKERRRILYGNLFKSWPWTVESGEVAAWWGFVIGISGIIVGVGIALWPILLTIGIIYGLGQAARGSRRLQKTVVRMVTELRKKADKDHNHDGVYVPAPGMAPKKVDLKTEEFGR